MALPPSPMPPPSPAAGGAPPDMGGAPMDDMPDAGGGEETVIATICRTADGQLKLYSGDEPEEGGDMPAGGAAEPGGAGGGDTEGQTFDSPGALMRGLMPLLDAGTAGAEDAFAGATRSGGSTAPEPAGAPMPG